VSLKQVITFVHSEFKTGHYTLEHFSLLTWYIVSLNVYTFSVEQSQVTCNIQYYTHV